jgi:hypothetical protein
MTNSFEKKPIKGGTPAIENSNIEMFRTKNEFWVNSLKVYKVLSLMFMKLKRVQKNEIRDKL